MILNIRNVSNLIIKMILNENEQVNIKLKGRRD